MIELLFRSQTIKYKYKYTYFIKISKSDECCSAALLRYSCFNFKKIKLKRKKHETK